MMTKKIEGEYVGREFPSISKSKLMTYKFCSYCLWKEVINKERMEESVKTRVGTNTHLIFAEFFRYFDINYVYENVKLDITTAPESNELTQYMYSICMELIPKQDRDVAVLQRIFWKFALAHTKRFYYLYNKFNGNKIKVYDYFIPSLIEAHLDSSDPMLYGTLDIEILTPGENENIRYVGDYKTGNVPAAVMRGLKDETNPYSWELPTRKNQEIHFYMILRLLSLGWKFSEEILKFLNNNEYLDKEGWHEFPSGKTKEEQKKIDKEKGKYLTSLKDKYKLYRFNKETGDFEYTKKSTITGGIIYLTGDPKVSSPITTIKEFSHRTYKSVLRLINKVRTTVNLLKEENADEYYLVKKLKNRPEYDPYKCPNCSRHSECLKKHEEFLQGK